MIAEQRPEPDDVTLEAYGRSSPEA